MNLGKSLQVLTIYCLLIYYFSKQPWVNPYADPNPAPRTNLGSGWNVFGVPSPSYSRTAPRQQTNNIW